MNQTPTAGQGSIAASLLALLLLFTNIASYSGLNILARSMNQAHDR